MIVWKRGRSVGSWRQQLAMSMRKLSTGHSEDGGIWEREREAHEEGGGAQVGVRGLTRSLPRMQAFTHRRRSQEHARVK